MWFNVVLVVFLFISFLITYAAIGNVLIRQKEILTKLELMNKAIGGIVEILKIDQTMNSNSTAMIKNVGEYLTDIANALNDSIMRATKQIEEETSKKGKSKKNA